MALYAFDKGVWNYVGDFTFVGYEKAKLSRGPGKTMEFDVTHKCGDSPCNGAPPSSIWFDFRGGKICFEAEGKCPDNFDVPLPKYK